MIKALKTNVSYIIYDNGFGHTVNWEYPGQIIEGIYTGKKENIGKKNQTIYTIKNNEGIFSVWETHSLKEFFETLTAPVGIKIRYKGKKEVKSSGNKVNEFSCFVFELPAEFNVEKDLWDVNTEDNES